MEERDIKIGAPVVGWDVLQFVDGLKAQIVGAKPRFIGGIDYVEFYLMPLDDLIKRYKIKDLDEQGCLTRIFQKEMIITLNEDDPARKLRFSLLTFEDKPTPATRWFKGFPQIEQMKELRIKIDHQKVYIAKLKYENLLFTQNLPKYIKTHFTSLMGTLLPLMQTPQPTGGENIPIGGGNPRR